MPNPARARARFRRVVENPWTTLLCLLFLGLSLQSLPRWSESRNSAAAYLRDRLGGALIVTDDFGWGDPRLIVARRPSGYEVMLPDEDSWGDAAAAIAASPHDTFILRFRGDAVASGPWALTFFRRTLSLRFEPPEAGARLNEPALLAVRAVASEFLAQRGYIEPEDSVRLARGDFVDRERLWDGWVHNGVVIAAAVGLAWSLLWVPQAWRRRRSTHAARSIARGLCPSCRYPISGIVGDYCPECEQRISVEA